jgi:hypothetical protein
MWFLIYVALAFVIIGLLLLLSGAILKYTASDGLQGKIGMGLMGAGLVMLPFIPP